MKKQGAPATTTSASPSSSLMANYRPSCWD
jgi:hypothetical protein